MVYGKHKWHLPSSHNAINQVHCWFSFSLQSLTIYSFHLQGLKKKSTPSNWPKFCCYYEEYILSNYAHLKWWRPHAIWSFLTNRSRMLITKILDIISDFNFFFLSIFSIRFLYFTWFNVVLNIFKTSSNPFYFEIN